MPETSPPQSAYEVLGVSPSANHDEIRRAYRRLARETHPDLGGQSARFAAIQVAWERIGKPVRRAEYDRAHGTTGAPRHPDFTGGSRHTAAGPESGSGAGPAPDRAAAPNPGRPAPDRSTRARPAEPSGARSYGHPGGLARERYLRELRLWLDVSTTPADPYDEALIESAPAPVHYWLAKALAEEATATAASGLGSGFTIWNDVAVPDTGDKVDHVVMGISGLYAVESASGRDGDRTAKQVAKNMRMLGKRLRAQFTALILVLPDEVLAEPEPFLARAGRTTVAYVRASDWVDFLRAGVPGEDRGTPDEVFEDRARLAERIRFA